MSTKAEMEAEIKELKKQIRDLKKDTGNSSVDESKFDNEVWGIHSYKDGVYLTHKIVQLKYNYETKQALVVGEMDRDFTDIYTSLGYITEKNNTYIMKRAQGRN